MVGKDYLTETNAPINISNGTYKKSTTKNFSVEFNFSGLFRQIRHEHHPGATGRVDWEFEAAKPINPPGVCNLIDKTLQIPYYDAASHLGYI